MENDYYKRLAIAALLQSPLSKVQVMLIARDMFGWKQRETRERFKEIADNCLLADSGTLCVKIGDAVYAETGDRMVFINDEFLAQCSIEQAAALADAKNKLLPTQGEEG